MKVLRRNTAPRYKRQEGITSYLLASLRTSDANHLTTTLVEIEPGGDQHLHSHAPEQVYFLLDGAGLMTVGNETAEVRAGDCVFVPTGATHGIKNHTKDMLRYFSAAAPSFAREELEALWPLGSEAERGPGSD